MPAVGLGVVKDECGGSERGTEFGFWGKFMGCRSYRTGQDGWPASSWFCWVVFVPLLQFQPPVLLFSIVSASSLFRGVLLSVSGHQLTCVYSLRSFWCLRALLGLNWEESQDLSEKKLLALIHLTLPSRGNLSRR